MCTVYMLLHVAIAMRLGFDEGNVDWTAGSTGEYAGWAGCQLAGEVCTGGASWRWRQPIIWCTTTAGSRAGCRQQCAGSGS